jgi:hypothetical protein
LTDLNGRQFFIGARHHFSLEVAFRPQKATAKLSNDAFYDIFCCQIKKLPWFDPATLPALFSHSDRKCHAARFHIDVTMNPK